MLTNDQNGTTKHMHTNMECIDYKRTIEGSGEQWRHIGGDMVAEFVRNWPILYLWLDTFDFPSGTHQQLLLKVAHKKSEFSYS